MDLTLVPHEPTRRILEAIENAMLNCLLYSPVLVQGTDTHEFRCSAFSYRIGGNVYLKGAEDDIAQPLTTTTSVQHVKELISINAAGTVALTAGNVAATAEEALLPATPAGSLAIGWLEIPVSFTPGTTALTNAMIKTMPLEITVDTTVGP
jgi:hypothetical protein